MGGAGVMADAEDGVRQSEIIQCDRALPDTDGLRQANTRSLMAHVGAVGEIVGAVRPNHQLIQEGRFVGGSRSEEHTSELQSLLRISYAVFCLKKKTIDYYTNCIKPHININ